MSARKKKKDLSLTQTLVQTNESIQKDMLQAKSLAPSLSVLMGPQDMIGQQWALTKETLLLGRSDECDITIFHRSISRLHLEISVFDTYLFVKNLSESSSISVNNEVSIEKGLQAQVRDGDRIEMGNLVLKFFAKGNVEAISMAKMSDKVNRDLLTGAYNRRGLEFQMKAASLAFKNKNLSCIFFDLDYFKKINDTRGHDAGDFVLKELSELLRNEVVRSEDCFARLGGEEFCLLSFGLVASEAVHLAERLRQSVAEHKFVYQGVHIPVTISAGVAIEDDLAQWEEAIKSADEALYESKKNGRNQVTYFGDK